MQVPLIVGNHNLRTQGGERTEKTTNQLSFFGITIIILSDNLCKHIKKRVLKGKKKGFLINIENLLAY
jgi:hypothetical protein